MADFFYNNFSGFGGVKMVRYIQQEYNIVCERIYRLINNNQDAIEPGSPEGEEIELLSLLVEKYEQEHFPEQAPDPIDAIKFRLE